MPRDKKQSKTKKFRASSDSDLISQTESEHSNASEPSSPKKKHRKASAKQQAASASDVTQGLFPPQPIHTGHISATNPFDDNPNPDPRRNHAGFMSRRMNPRSVNAAQFPGMMNSNFQRGIPPPSNYPGGPPPGPPNGPPPHPMFNMNNPHGPPLVQCGVCRQEVHDTEDAIQCESGCNMWFHRLCTGLTEAAYSLLTTEYLAEWACDRCIKEKKIPMVRVKPQPVMLSGQQ